MTTKGVICRDVKGVILYYITKNTKDYIELQKSTPLHIKVAFAINITDNLGNKRLY